MEEVIFIDLEGNIIEYNEICSHIGLSSKLISENEILKKLFIESGYKRPDLFLINEIGYISVSVDPNYGIRLIANSEKINSIQKEIIKNYLLDGGKISYIDVVPNSQEFGERHNSHTK